MELEELKHIWNAHTSDAIDEQEVDAQTLRKMVRQRSQSALQLINRNIWIELGIILGLGVGVWAWFSFTLNKIFAWELLPIAVFMVISVVFYLYKYKLINRTPLGNVSLKENLIELSQTLGRFMKLYYIMAFVVLPLVGSIFFILGMNFGLEAQGGSISNITYIQWAILGAALITYVAFVIVGTRWYVNKIYGRHYHTLVKCLKELSEIA